MNRPTQGTQPENRVAANVLMLRADESARMRDGKVDSFIERVCRRRWGIVRGRRSSPRGDSIIGGEDRDSPVLNASMGPYRREERESRLSEAGVIPQGKVDPI